MRNSTLCFLLVFIFSCANENAKKKNQLGNIDSKLVENTSTKIQPVDSEKLIEIVNKKQVDYSQKKYKVWEYSTPSLTTCKTLNSNIIASIINKASSAFLIQFDSNYDSCTFIGWNEMYKAEVTKIDDNAFRVENGDYSYWDFKFISENELHMRSVYYKKNYKDKFTAYHGIDSLYSDFISIEKRITNIAKELILGDYKVVFNDSIDCESEITFGDSTKTQGFKEFTRYRFRLGDWEYPSDYNEIVLLKKNWEKRKFAFDIISDTLILKEIGEVYTDPGSGFYIRSDGKTRLKLIKKE